MFRLVASFLLSVATIFATSSSASAHRPYITQVERIVLPDGEAGELRIVNGDGILGPDPQALLVLNSDRDVIARSPRSDHLHIVCRQPTDCKVFDLEADTVIELDPSTFKATYVAKALEGEDEADWWMTFLDQRGSWGTRSRQVTWTELANANWSLLKTTWLRFAFVMIMGIGAGFVRGVLPSEKLAAPRSRLRLILVLLLKTAWVGLFTLVALIVMFAGRWTGSLWLVAFAAGIAASLLFMRFIDQRAASVGKPI